MKIMFYGYPVEKLCTFQYSLVSLLPGARLFLYTSAFLSNGEHNRATTSPG